MAELVIADKRHKHRLPREVLEQMRRCLLIQMPAVGFDVIDHRAAAEFDIAVANSAGYNRDGVADWTVMAILNLVRRGSWGDRRMREGGWPKPEMLGHELAGLTVGIVGLGNVGSALATRLLAFGSRVVYADIVERSFSGVRRVPFVDLLELAAGWRRTGRLRTRADAGRQSASAHGERLPLTAHGRLHRGGGGAGVGNNPRQPDPCVGRRGAVQRG